MRTASSRAFFVPLLALGLLSGCASNKVTPVQRTVLNGFRGGSVTMSQREKPGFSASTAGKATFGVLGVAAMFSAGNAIVRDNDIPDPALQIRQALIAELEKSASLSVISSSNITDDTDTAKLAKQYAAADLLLDVQTTGWGFVYFPDRWTHYRVILQAKVRLIDNRHAALIAEGACAYVQPETAEAPNYTELLQERAARLKRELGAAAHYCVGQFQQRMLGP